MLPNFLSALTEFKYYNFVFDGIIIFFTVIYLIAGFRRGMRRTLWYVIFDVITIAAIFCIVKFVCPLFIDKIPVVLVNLFPNIGIVFALTTLYRFILKCLVIILSYLIIRLGIFKAILNKMKENDITQGRKKKFFGRVVSALLTAGVAFTLSSGAIVSTRKMTQYTLFRNYDSEMSETYVAKYGDKYIVNLVRNLIATESMDNPHNMLIKSITNGKHEIGEVIHYRDAIYRLGASHNPYYYFEVIGIEEEKGLIRFSEDLHFWAILAETNNHKELFNQMVNPLLKHAVEKGYDYNGDVSKLAPLNDFKDMFNEESYSYLTTVFF